MTSQAELACQLAILIRQVRDMQDAMYRHGFMAAPPGISFPSCTSEQQTTRDGVTLTIEACGSQLAAELATARNTIDALRYAAKQNAENSARLMVHDELTTRELAAVKLGRDVAVRDCNDAKALLHEVLDAELVDLSNDLSHRINTLLHGPK